MISVLIRLHPVIYEEINRLPLNNLINLIWQQDGAPTHSVLAVSEYLNVNYNKWIGGNVTILLPPNSRKLTPPDTLGIFKIKIMQKYC